MFEGLKKKIRTSGASINCGGRRRPRLLLHGYPEAHAMWHKVAPRLAPSTRGLPRPARLRRLVEAAGLSDHSNYSSAHGAHMRLQHARSCGHDRFLLVGTIARPCRHRLARDHAGAA